MTFAEALEMEDAYSAMCELSVLIALKASTRAELSPSEQVISDIMWLDTQVCANGFDGWLYNTTCARIVQTIEALSAVGSSILAGVAAKALVVVCINPRTECDGAKQTLLESLSNEQRQRLSTLDSEYYDAAAISMTTCREFVASRRIEFCLS